MLIEEKYSLERLVKELKEGKMAPHEERKVAKSPRTTLVRKLHMLSMAKYSHNKKTMRIPSIGRTAYVMHMHRTQGLANPRSARLNALRTFPLMNWKRNLLGYLKLRRAKAAHKCRKCP